MNKDAAYQRLAMRIFADFSGTIAVPAVLGALLGKWLDNKLGTEPWLLITVLTSALVATAVIVVRKAKHYSEIYNSLDEKKITD